MVELLSMYSVSEIMIFIIVLGLAIKELFTFIDWVRDRIKKYFNKEVDSKEILQKLEQKNKEQDERIDQILSFQTEISNQVTTILKQVQNLTVSDRDAIKAYITKEHHQFCYENGWIDDYSLDCLEKRFSRYKDEGGNSFVESLMEELRALPRQPFSTPPIPRRE